MILALGCLKVKAASTCSYKEQAALNKEAANIKATYEEQTEYYMTQGCNMESCAATEYYFKISVLNLSKNFYIIVKNANDSSMEFLSYSLADNGIVSFNNKNIMETNTYTFTVYSSDETGCPNEKYRTFTLKTPRYNEYSTYVQCEKSPEFEMCQKYVNFDIDYYDFAEKVEEYNNKKITEEQEKNISFIQKVFNFIDNNKKAITILGVTGFVIVGGVTIFIIKRRKDREI